MTSIHPTAYVEPGVTIGDGTSIWDNVHVRHSTSIGVDCIVGEKSYVAYGVHIGNRVKINAFVYIPTGVRIEDGVMVSAGTVFTNDRFPRAATKDLSALLPSDPNDETLETIVRRGATIGAHATIGCGITIGQYAMVGMGSVVTQNVPDFHLVVGSPARSIGFVCRCGQSVAKFGTFEDDVTMHAVCPKCGERYETRNRRISPLLAIA